MSAECGKLETGRERNQAAGELAAELYEVGRRQLGARYTFADLTPDQREAWLAVARHVLVKIATVHVEARA